MNRIISLLSLTFSLSAIAGLNSNSIHSIVRGEDGEPHIVKFHSGAVEFIEHDEKHRLTDYERKASSQKLQEQNIYKNMELFQETQDYEPSRVPDSELSKIFKQMNPYMKRRSECSDRAHVWAWDEFQRSGIKSEKAFLLLTDAYIRRNRYKWWFHVAPMFTTTSGKKIVMDFQFIDRPVTFTEWKNSLVFSKRDCVKDFKFLDYDAGADQTQDCYVKFEPMYYYIPGDIGAREKGRFTTKWNTSQVNASRARAFFQRNQQ